MPPSSTGEAMTRHSKTSGAPAKSRRPKSSKLKRHSPPKVAGSRPSRTGAETEVTQLRRELHEALEQQTATSEVLQVISTSSGDLEPVFASMLENAVRICDAGFGDIFRQEGDSWRLVATYKTPAAFVEVLRHSPVIRPSLAVGRRRFADKSAVHIADLAADPDYVERRIPHIVAAVELGGVRTTLFVPLVREDELRPRGPQSRTGRADQASQDINSARQCGFSISQDKHPS
jgi:two-component system, NtrC family, sensor kinase